MSSEGGEETVTHVTESEELFFVRTLVDLLRYVTDCFREREPLAHGRDISEGGEYVLFCPSPRPSRTNTDNLNDVYPSQRTTPAQRRISVPTPISQNGVLYADPNEQMPPVASTPQSPF